MAPEDPKLRQVCMAVIIGGPGVPELVLTASVCTPVRCLGCRILNIGCEFTSIVDINLVLYFHNPVALKYMTQGDPLSERVYDYSR
jgi:hypothetical protein